MDRRGFVRTITQAGIGLGLTPLAEATDQQTDTARPERGGKPTFRDVGWVWEGQGIDPKVPPSIYGLGQAAVLIDGHRAQADAVRDFIADHSKTT